jgi:hypothetical protein
MAGVLLALVAVAFALGLGFLAWRRTSSSARSSRRLALYALLAGALAGVLSQYIERLVLTFTGLDFDVKVAGVTGSLMAVFLLAAPLEEAAKVLVIWPLYRTRRIDGPRLGVAYASVAASGFAASEDAWLVIHSGGSALSLLRALLGVFAHLFFAAAWGYALLAGRVRGRWFALTWAVAVLLHALYDHIVWGRGPGYLTAALPMLAFMLLGAWAVQRETEPGPARHGHGMRLEPPSLREVREALRPAERPVMLRWVGVGAFVTLGLVITLSLVSVFVGRRMGIDFTLADEADVRSAGPLALLGTGVVVAFPLAGYLIARASAAHSVLEPALSTLVALVALIVLLSLTAPIAVLFALALTPIAIGLACGGAWIGLER